MSIDVISALFGLILTLLVFSYLIGDNPLFRFAVYLFIGSASGYVALVVYYQLLLPKLQSLSLSDPLQLIVGIIPFFLGVTLFAKLSPRISWIGKFAMAVLVGVGAATAIGGALIGTLIPQSQATVGSTLNLGAMLGNLRGGVEGIVMLLGTLVTLIYFQFSASRAADGTTRRNTVVELLALFGRVFIAITFGVLFAGVYMAALTAMIERLSSIINFVKSLLGF